VTAQPNSLMKEELAEVIAKAARDPDAYAELGLRYERGHEMSQRTRFELGPGGAYTLRSVNPRTQRVITFEGRLEPAQRSLLLTAVDSTRLLDVPQSSRPIGDDELPVIVELGYDGSHFRLPIWAGDAAANTQFRSFEQELWTLFEQLSDGQIRRPPTLQQ
jgi:hypothetical protein